MSKMGSKTFLAFGDLHIPHHDPDAVQVILDVIHKVKPDLVVILGDMLNLSHFSNFRGIIQEANEDYLQDVGLANKILDQVQRDSKKVVFLEGNHEARIDRWSAEHTAGRSMYSMIAPRHVLTRGRSSKFSYVPYFTDTQTYSHYKITPSLIAVHGWTWGKMATKRHLELARGVSIIHGHSHRAQTEYGQLPFSLDPVEARSAGCLCKKVELRNVGSPKEWVHCFILGYWASAKDFTMYTCVIRNGKVVLPSGETVYA